MKREKIHGFEFMLTAGSEIRWVRLWSGAGFMGDGVLALLNAPSPPRNLTVAQAEAAALRRARAELRIHGKVREFTSWDRPASDRIVVTTPADIRACRAIYHHVVPSGSKGMPPASCT